jgi:hypothetical protein
MIVGRRLTNGHVGGGLTNGVAELELLGDSPSVIVGVAHDGPASLVANLVHGRRCNTGAHHQHHRYGHSQCPPRRHAMNTQQSREAGKAPSPPYSPAHTTYSRAGRRVRDHAGSSTCTIIGTMYDQRK